MTKHSYLQFNINYLQKNVYNAINNYYHCFFCYEIKSNVTVTVADCNRKIIF